MKGRPSRGQLGTRLTTTVPGNWRVELDERSPVVSITEEEARENRLQWQQWEERRLAKEMVR